MGGQLNYLTLLQVRTTGNQESVQHEVVMKEGTEKRQVPRLTRKNTEPIPASGGYGWTRAVCGQKMIRWPKGNIKVIDVNP